jgi:hypothetical protein
MTVTSSSGFIAAGGSLGAQVFMAANVNFIMRLIPFIGVMNNTYYIDFLMSQPKFFDANFLRPEQIPKVTVDGDSLEPKSSSED